jgi:uncharacterized damage-inducible protein DinB
MSRITIEESDTNKSACIETSYQHKGNILMDEFWKTAVWQQFGAAIDMLQNAIEACPEAVWGDRSQTPEFWYTAFHTLFFIDLYLSESEVGFRPPPPFTLDEMDERGLLPDRVYTKGELLAYLAHGREKCRQTIAAMTEERAHQRCGFSWLDISVAESLLYNMRHVQHHAGQLNTLLRQRVNAAPRWVRKTTLTLGG